MRSVDKVLVTGGAGYVGAKLVPALIENGYSVIVYDLFLYGDVFDEKLFKTNRLKLVKADIRDIGAMKDALPGCDAVIHLACISNDPSFELNPDLGKSINYDAFEPLVKLSVDAGIKRFVYASSSSVYGVKDEESVIESLVLEPLTDYSRYKALCEDVLQKYSSKNFTALTVRPATVCGYSSRQRLDLIVNILANHAYTNRKIKVFGGNQYRPNIHIDDMVRFYLGSLVWDASKVAGEIFNVGHVNYTVNEIALMVKEVVGDDVVLQNVPTNDERSYRVCSEKIKESLGFSPLLTIKNAVEDLLVAFNDGQITDQMESSRYYNIKRMQEVALA